MSISTSSDLQPLQYQSLDFLFGFEDDSALESRSGLKWEISDLEDSEDPFVRDFDEIDRFQFLQLQGSM